MLFRTSGFILTYNYAGNSIDVRRFLEARIARVYPVYVFGLVTSVHLFFHDLVDAPSQIVVGKIFAGLVVLALLQAWSPQLALTWNFPSWSLSNEAFFYWVFPSVSSRIHALRTNSLLVLALLLWCVSQIPPSLYLMWRNDASSRLIDQSDFIWYAVVLFNPLLRLPEFLIGIVFGSLFLRHRSQLQNERTRRMLGAALSLSMAVAVMGLAAFSDQLHPIVSTSQGFMALLFGGMIYGLAVGGGPLARFLSNRIAVLLGEASYAIYILHVPVLYYAYKLEGAWLSVSAQSNWGFAILNVGVVILISILTLHWLETPARRALRAYFDRRAQNRMNHNA